MNPKEQQENSKSIVEFLNESINAGTLKAFIGDEGWIVLNNNGQECLAGIDIRLRNTHAGGDWHVNDYQ